MPGGGIRVSGLPGESRARGTAEPPPKALPYIFQLAEFREGDVIELQSSSRVLVDIATRKDGINRYFRLRSDPEQDSQSPNSDLPFISSVNETI